MTDTCPLDQVLPISVSIAHNSFKTKGPATEFILLPPLNALSDFEDESIWSTLVESQLYGWINSFFQKICVTSLLKTYETVP